MTKPIIISGILSQVGKSTKVDGNAWKYEYIRIDDQRIDNIFVANYINDEFYGAHRESVTLSIMPIHKKNHGGMVLAIRSGNRIERCPELTAGQAWAVTLISVGQNILALAFVGAIAWFFAMLAVALLFGGVIEIFGLNVRDNSVFNSASIVSGVLLIWAWLHATFISKNSIIGSRKALNAASRALD